MRRSTKLACTIFIAGVGGLVACTGGGGDLMTPWNGWDYDKGAVSERELPANDAGVGNDPATSSREAPPLRGQDPEPESVLGCSGKFECVVTGTSQTCVTVNGTRTCNEERRLNLRVEVGLARKDGKCTIGDLVLEPNGTFVNTDDDDDDPQTGTWTPYGNGFKLVAAGTSIVCLRSAPLNPFGNGSGRSQTIEVSSGGASTSSSSSTSSSTSGGVPPGDDVPGLDASF